MEQLVSRPIEEAVSAVTGADTVSSTSAEGVSSVTIEFTWGTNLDEAASDVRDRLDRVVSALPDDADRRCCANSTPPASRSCASPSAPTSICSKRAN